MKTHRSNRFLAFLQPSSPALAIAAIFFVASIESASSATLTWDTAPGTVGAGNGTITGGVGNWDTTPSLGNWTADGGATNVAWVNNATPDAAIFNGTGGIVTQAGVVTSAMTFSTTGYTVTGGTLTMGSPSPKITADADATVTSVLAGTTGLTKDGTAILSIGTKATYTGNTIVNAGVLNLSGGGGASGTIRGTVDVNNGAILRFATQDATGYGTGADRLGIININTGSTLNINTTLNQTLGNGVINLTGAAITGVANSNLDFFQTSSALNSLASPVTSSVTGTRLSIRQTAGLTLTVAPGTTPSGIDLDIGSIISNNGTFATAPLIKAGTGTVLLRGTNNYTGATNINAGTLILGATGSATTSDYTVNAGTLRLINTGKTLKSLTANAGSSLILPASKTGTTTVTNALATNGAITVKPEFLDVPAAADVYNLATAASSSGVPAFTVDTSSFGASRVAATAAVAGNILQLTISSGAANLVWNNNAATGIWNHNTTANFDNGGSPDVFKTFDGVTFNGTAPGTITLAGSLQPSAVNVTSSSGDYTFAGSGSLVGGILTKSGSSVLTISNSNSHPSTVITGGVLNANGSSATGGLTTVNGGTLNLGLATALGSGGLVLTSGTFDNTSGAALTISNPLTLNGATAFTGTNELTTTGAATLTVDSGLTVNASTLTMNGVISGAFSLGKSGAGTLRLNAAHTYSGATTVSGTGRLWVSNSLRNTSSITVGTGSTLELGATNIFVAGHGITMGNTRVITVNGGTMLMNNLMDARFGNVTLNDAATWTSNRILTNYDALLANTDTGAATVTVGGTGTSVMNGTGGIHLQGVQNFAVADTTSSVAADLNVNMILGDPGTSAGALGGVNKTGVGTMVLNAVNTYTGATTVNEGTLQIGATGSATTSTFTVSAATLQVDATEKTVNSLTVNTGSTLTLAAKKSETLHVTNALTTAGAITLKPVFNDGPAAGDKYDLVSAATFSDGGSYTVDMTSRGATRVTATAAAEASQYLVLTIGTGAANLIWNNNAATGIWNHNADANFNNGGSNDVFKSYDSVTFGNTAAGTVNLVGTLYPGLVTVDSSSDYTFGGSGTLGGGSLVKSGTSTLNLTTAQSPASVTLNAGTLNASHASALGTGRITLNGGIFNNGTGATLTLANPQTWDTAATFTGSDLVINGAVIVTVATEVTVGPSSLTVGGAIADGGFGLTKKGAGVMTLNGAANSTLIGLLKVANGTLAVNTGTGAGLVEVGTGPDDALLTIDGNQQLTRLANMATVTVGGNGIVSINGVNAIPNHANSCNFTVETGGLLSFVSGGSTAIGAAGTSHHHVGTITLNGGTVSLPYSGTGAAYNGESVQMNGNIVVGGSTPSTIEFGSGALVANAGIALGTLTPHTVTVADVTGNASADLVINAELENSDGGSAALTKDGLGTLFLAGNFAHSYTSSTTVTAGTLAATGSIVGPLIVEAAGTIAPGASAGTFGAGATTIAGTYACEIDGANADTLAVTGDLILTGSTLNLSVLGGGATQPSYVIATYTGTRTGEFTPVNVPSGYSVSYNDGLKQIELVAGTTYATWIGGFPGAAGAPGFNQDADNDGIKNGVEHLLGTDPSVGTTGLYQVSATANSVTFRHSQTNSLASDVTKSYEWSSDLVEWKASGVANTGNTIGTIVATTITDNAAPANDVIEVVVTASGTPTTKLFARVVANQ